MESLYQFHGANLHEVHENMVETLFLFNVKMFEGWFQVRPEEH